MKGAAVFVAIFAALLLAIPMIALNFEATPVSRAEAEEHSPASAPAHRSGQDDGAAEEPEDYGEAVKVQGVESFLIYDLSEGESRQVPARDYVRGAVAMEMPASFHPEALKAQAVAAHTYALNQWAASRENPDPSIDGADFAADPSNRIGYITEEQALAFYGEDGREYWQKVCDAADSVLDQVLVYEEEPIVSAYHAISAGRTEDAGNVWEGSAPYLQAVESQGDYLAPDYQSEVVFSSDEAARIIGRQYPGADLSGVPEEWFGKTLYSDSGYVIYATVGGVEIPGTELREMFGLRSHNFDLSADGEEFNFQVYGYGHGVGLSQYGADYLAREGYTYEEILLAYYTGVELTKVG